MCWRILKLNENDESIVYSYDTTSVGELTGEFEIIKNSHIYYINKIAKNDTEQKLDRFISRLFYKFFSKGEYPAQETIACG